MFQRFFLWRVFLLVKFYKLQTSFEIHLHLHNISVMITTAKWTARWKSVFKEEKLYMHFHINSFFFVLLLWPFLNIEIFISCLVKNYRKTCWIKFSIEVINVKVGILVLCSPEVTLKVILRLKYDNISFSLCPFFILFGCG